MALPRYKLIILALLLAIFAFSLPAQSNADLVRHCYTLMSNTTAGGNAQAVSTTGAIYSDSVPESARALTAVALGTNNSGTTPTMDVKIQSCRSNNATTCSDTFTFDQCTTGVCWTGGVQNIDLNQASANAFPYFRAKTTLAGTSPNYDITVLICFK